MPHPPGQARAQQAAGPEAAPAAAELDAAARAAAAAAPPPAPLNAAELGGAAAFAELHQNAFYHTTLYGLERMRYAHGIIRQEEEAGGADDATRAARVALIDEGETRHLLGQAAQRAVERALRERQICESTGFLDVLRNAHRDQGWQHKLQRRCRSHTGRGASSSGADPAATAAATSTAGGGRSRSSPRSQQGETQRHWLEVPGSGAAVRTQPFADWSQGREGWWDDRSTSGEARASPPEPPRRGVELVGYARRREPAAEEWEDLFAFGCRLRCHTPPLR